MEFNPITGLVDNRQSTPIISLPKPVNGQRMNKAEYEHFVSFYASQWEEAAYAFEAAQRYKPREEGESKRAYEKRIKHADVIIGVQSLSAQDWDLLYHITKFKLIGLHNAAILNNVKPATAKLRLQKLTKLGLLQTIPVSSPSGVIWYATKQACDLFHSYASISKPRNSKIAHEEAVSYVAAHLINGTQHNILELPQWPVQHRTNYRTQALTYGETLISERELQAAKRIHLNGELNANSYSDAIIAHHAIYDQWIANGASLPAPEQQPGGYWHYILWGNLERGIHHRVPDLIIERPRDPNQPHLPQSIAVEIELSKKPSKAYEGIARHMAEGHAAIAKIIWVCNSKAIFNAIKTAAETYGIYGSRISCVLFSDQRGPIKGDECWLRSE